MTWNHRKIAWRVESRSGNMIVRSFRGVVAFFCGGVGSYASRGRACQDLTALPATGDLRRPIRPGSLSGEILLTPQEARAGGVLPLDVPLTAACPSCEGTGGYVFDCERCAGEGTIERRLPVPVRIPAGVPEGTVFQVSVDDPAVLSILLTVHIRQL